MHENSYNLMMILRIDVGARDTNTCTMTMFLYSNTADTHERDAEMMIVFLSNYKRVNSSHVNLMIFC